MASPRREYVLDHVLERKGMEDLVSSIKGNQRFVRQKFWLQRCRLSTVYYLLEGSYDHLPGQQHGQQGSSTAAGSLL